MTVKELRSWLLKLPGYLDHVDVIAVRTYPDESSLKEIQQAIYKEWDHAVYLYLK